MPKPAWPKCPKGEIGGFPYTRMALQPLATDSAEPGVT
ncbi:unnamed protein product [Ciceribacter sp. T2.26MG-112.2]|nr:unnamed protein product [Ciceribacter naphthalenivorans]